ncbi:nucleotide-diphospho-sugar transferase [Mycena metata]|uniref:Nucleotide-diphospho-sugar transferase n=1 Tax=Mycena metata TaxID=1033252 RepID=A0AAD7NTL6_9AGAR|nr:nucleotide-diphospho-sugar transferase [Mycena metata]
MNTQIRYIFLALAVLLTVHYTLSFTNEGYGSATSFSRLKEQFTGTASTAAGSKSGSTTGSKPGSTSRLAHNASVPDEYYLGNKVSLGRKADAAIVMLARNGDLDGTITSVKQMEDRFNKKFNYPYVFLNEEPFSDEFKSRVSALTDSTVQFGLIPHDHWYQPDWYRQGLLPLARRCKKTVLFMEGVFHIVTCAAIIPVSFSAMNC